MPSTYTSSNGIELIATGEQSGTWGETTNTNLSIVDRVLSGVGTIDLSGSGAAHTLTTTDGTLSDGMYKGLVLTGATTACTITISPNDAQKIYFVENNSGQTCTFTQGSGGNVSVANGENKIIFADGGGAGAAVTDFSNDLATNATDSTKMPLAGGTFTGDVSFNFNNDINNVDNITMGSTLSHVGDTDTYFSFSANNTIEMKAGNTASIALTSNTTTLRSGGSNATALTLPADNAEINGLRLGLAVGFTSTDNTYFGKNAGNILSGSPNYSVAIGSESGRAAGVGNVEVGYATNGGSAASRNSNYRVCIGYNAGFGLGQNTSTGSIIAIGASAYGGSGAGTNLSYSGAIGIGYRALFVNTSGYQNCAVGSEAGTDLTTAYNTTLFGTQAGTDITTGYQNTCVGYRAGARITSGFRNTCIGTLAGDVTTTGDYNITIGWSADPSSSSANGQCTLGDSNITNLRCNDTSISSLSDRRDKTNIIDSPYGLTFLTSLRPRQFLWQSRDGNGKDGTTRLGFIAQELLEACDGQNDVLDLVLEDNPEKLEARITNLIPIIVQSIKDLTDRVETLESV